MTKEMRPSHRIDVLCSALTHYDYQTKVKLGKCAILLCTELLNYSLCLQLLYL